MCKSKIALKYLSRRGIHGVLMLIRTDLWLRTGNGIRTLQGWDRRFGYFPWLSIGNDWNNVRISTGRWDAQELLSIISGALAMDGTGNKKWVFVVRTQQLEELTRKQDERVVYTQFWASCRKDVRLIATYSAVMIDWLRQKDFLACHLSWWRYLGARNIILATDAHPPQHQATNWPLRNTRL